MAVTLRKLRHKHDLASYVRAIAQCGDDHKRACKIFQTVKDWNEVPDLHTLNALINVAARAQNLSLCWDMFNDMRCTYDVCPNHETYLILCGAMLKQEHYMDIVDMFAELVEQSKHLCARGLNNASILHTMFYVLPTSIIALGKLKRVSEAKRLFDEWVPQCVETGAGPYNPILNAMVSVFCAHGQVSAALDLLQSQLQLHQDLIKDDKVFVSLMKKSGVESEAVYNMALSCGGITLHVNLFQHMMVQHWQNKEWAKCYVVWKNMLSHKIEADSSIYVYVVHCLVHLHEWHEVNPLINSMLTKCRNNQLVCSTQLARSMIWCVNEMQRHSPQQQQQQQEQHSGTNLFLIAKYEWGLVPDTEMYNELLYFAIKQCDYNDALAIVDEMKCSNVMLNTRTFNILISGLARLQRIDLIDELLVDMRHCGCAMNGATYVNLMNAAAQSGNVTLCVEYLSQLMQLTNNAYVDSNCYAHVLNAYANQFTSTGSTPSESDLEQVFAYWREQCGRSGADYIIMLKCMRNYTMAAMNNGSGGGAASNESLQVFAQLRDDCHNDADTLLVAYNLLFDILFTTRDIDLAIKYFEQAQSDGIYRNHVQQYQKDDATVYELDVHGMTTYPATFATLHFLRSLRSMDPTTLRCQIVTGVGLTSIDWTPVLQPHISNLLHHQLSQQITFHIPSYNEGVLVIDQQSIRALCQMQSPITISS